MAKCKHERVDVTRTEQLVGSFDLVTQNVTLDSGPSVDWDVECQSCGITLEAGISNYKEI